MTTASKFLRTITASLVVIVFHQAAIGQVFINGTIYERSARFGLSGVSVMGASGIGTTTDSLGHYKIVLMLNDSISFSYLGKTTQRIPIKAIPPNQPFDMTLEVAMDSLPTVLVRNRNYREDSLENRREYQKAFDYEPGFVPDMKGSRKGGFGVGLDMDLLFDGKANRQMEALQKRLEQEEQDKYIDHRFTKALVKRITGLQLPALDTFMIKYRPNLETLKGFETDYEYYKYIQDQASDFLEIWKKDHP